MNSRRLALVVALVLSLAASTSATPVGFQFYASTLNKIAGAVGSVSGDAGTYDVDLNTPFGTIVLFRADLYWTLSNVNFQVTPQGVSFTGQLTLSYSRFSYSTNVTGSATASFQQSPTALVFSVSNIVVPVGFNLPIVGTVTLTTLTVNPQSSFTVYMSPAVFNQPTPSGVPETIYAQVTQAAISYQAGYVQIDCGASIW